VVTDDDLIARLASLQASIDNVRSDMEREAVKRDKRIKTNQRAIIAAIGVAVLAVLVGGLGVKTARDANSDRAARTIVACKQYNRQQNDQADAERAESHDFVTALTAGSTDPDIGTKAAMFNAKHDALIASAHKLRDCSPKGIAAFYSPNGAK